MKLTVAIQMDHVSTIDIDGDSTFVLGLEAERREILEKAARLAKTGKTAAGAILSQLILIADSREAATALRAEAEKAGLKHVVYATDDHLLDPFPEGSWVDPAEAAS